MADRIVAAEEAQYWNLMQVMAWVHLGDRSLVRDAGLPASERGYFFEEHTLPDGRREFVKVRRRFTVMTLQVAQADRGSACYPALRLAQDAIIEALKAGRLTAYGLQNGEGDLKEIPTLSWADLKFWYEPDFAGPKDVFRDGATHWHSLTFQRKDVLAIWPDPFDQLDPLRSADQQPAGPTAETQSPERRAHNEERDTAPPSNIFRTMTGLEWKDVSMTFIEPEAVRVRARGKTTTVTYEAMGFKNQQSRMAKPNKVWDTLRTLAIVTSTSKTLADTFPSQTDFKRRVSRLRDALQEFFGIKDDPLPYSGGEYKRAFILTAEEHVIKGCRDHLRSDDEDAEAIVDVSGLVTRPRL